jgi:hypothetical protein
MACVGLAMMIAGRRDPLGVHGFLVAVVSVGMIFVVGAGYFAPEPTEDRQSRYYDDPSKVGVILAMIWAVVGFTVGDWVAWQLFNPNLTFDAWSNFGRLRPVHTTAVIFGFGGNALIATSFHVLQRTSRARLPDQVTPWFVLLGYNLFCLIAVSGYVMGITKSKEYAESEWYNDIWLVIRLDHVFRALSAHPGPPQRTSHLCGELVFHGLYRGRCNPAHHKQPVCASFTWPCEELLAQKQHVTIGGDRLVLPVLELMDRDKHSRGTSWGPPTLPADGRQAQAALGLST